MTELRQEAFALISMLPEEKEDVLVSIIKSLREVLGINPQSRANKNLAIMNDIQDIIGDDIPWANEEEMIRELAEMRRQKLKL